MEQFNTIPTSGNWADIAGILDANFLRCWTALVQSQSLIGLDGSNYKGMYTSASALPDDMTEAGWALVGSSLSALQLYVFNDGATDWALFSNETYNFTSWTEFQTQLDALSTQVTQIGSNLVELENKVNEKLPKQPGTNLFDKDSALTKCYLTYPNGTLSVADTQAWVVSDYIPVNGQDIISSAFSSEQGSIASYVVYDEHLNILRAIKGNAQYTYQAGDAFVRFTFNNVNTGRANYGTTLAKYEPYTSYLPVTILQGNVQELQDNVFKLQGNVQELQDDVFESDVIVIDATGNIEQSYLAGIEIHQAASAFYSVNYWQVQANKKYSIRLTNGTINTGGTSIKMTLFTTVLPTYGVSGESIFDVGQSIDAPFEYIFTPNSDGYICLYSNSLQQPGLQLYDLVISSRIVLLEQKSEQLDNDKLDKQLSANLINPAKLLVRKYINSTGGIGNADSERWIVSEMIPINGQNMICNGTATSYARAWVAYDTNKNITHVAAEGEKSYTYQDGDVYIQFGFVSSNTNPCYANYGDELIEIAYSDYQPIAELNARVTALEEGSSSQDVNILYQPYNLYSIWNDLDTTRQNVLKIGLSRVIGLDAYFNKNVKFSNGLRFIPIVPTTVTQVTETNLTIEAGSSIKTCTLRNTPASLSAEAKPRILVIGDSVTSGYGSNSNKAISWHPSQYWAYAKMFFEMDKIDNGDSGHDVLFVGGFVSNGSFNINYKSIQRSVRVKAEGKGGAALQELYNQTWGGSDGTTNPFYDEVNQTFSILAYLANYRTMDDAGVRLVSQSSDPHGEVVTGSDGNQYTIGQKITSQALLANYDICTPTHVFINLNHNTSVANFEAKIADVVNIVKTELPGVVFAWLCIDSTGTNFPIDYPDYDQTMIRMMSLHTKNNGFYKYFHDNIENESDDIYLLGMNFIQPEGIDFPFTEIEQNGGFGSTYKIANKNVGGATYHPNNIAHSAWGYELYAFIKWLISKDI